MLKWPPDFFTKNIDRTWRLLENLEAGMIGMNTGNSSAAESPFGGIKESGYGKESGKDVAVAEVSLLVPMPRSVCALLTLYAVHDYEDRHAHAGGALLDVERGALKCTHGGRVDIHVRRNTAEIAAARAVLHFPPHKLSPDR